MCPNYQVLSAFFDGELPASQQSKIIEHTTYCEACRERLESYQSIKEYLLKAGTNPGQGSQEKVWQRLTLSLKEIKQKQEKRAFFWQKQLLIPLPVILLGKIALFLI